MNKSVVGLLQDQLRNQIGKHFSKKWFKNKIEIVSASFLFNLIINFVAKLLVPLKTERVGFTINFAAFLDTNSTAPDDPSTFPES